MAASLLLYLPAKESHRELLKQNESNLIKRERTVLESHVRRLTSDLMVLVRQRDLARLLATGDPVYRERVEQAFLSFSEFRRVFDQIRYIDQQGREVIRISLGPDGPFVEPEARLQDKSGRYYFTHTTGLAPGEVYLSPLDLNVERGMVEVPFKAVIRAATPVVDAEGARHGVLVLNFLAQGMLDRMAETAAEYTGQVMLVGDSGHFIKGLTGNDAWGSQLPSRRGSTLSNRFPKASKRIFGERQGQFLLPEGLFSFTTVEPGAAIRDPGRIAPVTHPPQYAAVKGAETWKLVSFVPIQAWNRHGETLLLTHYIVDGVAITLAAIACWLLAVARRNRQWAAQVAHANAALGGDGDDDHESPLITTDRNGRVLSWNLGAEMVFGTGREDAVGSPFPSHLSGAGKARYAETLARIIAAGGGTVSRTVELTGRRPDGGVFPLECTVSTWEEAGETFLAIVPRDTTETKQAEANLRRLTATDRLTGLHNRHHFETRLRATFKYSRHHKTPMAILLIDVDHLATINETQGDRAGDTSLKRVAQIVLGEVRDSDIPCRYSGGEIAVILPGTTLRSAAPLAERIRQKVEALSVTQGNTTLSQTVSIGIADLEPDGDSSAQDLVLSADQALYRAKKRGRNQVINGTAQRGGERKTAG